MTLGAFDENIFTKALLLHIEKSKPGSTRTRPPLSSASISAAIQLGSTWVYRSLPGLRTVTVWRGRGPPAGWSPELWQLVQDGTISLATMAFVLRTSPEGLR